MPIHTAADTKQLTPAAARYLQDIRSGLKLKIFFYQSLPSALWWGIQVKSAAPDRAEVTIPYNWRTKNPFRSIYFAALCGAAELSTGVLANLARMGKGNIALLIVGQQAEFVKKATGTTTFTCEEGNLAFEAVERAIQSRQPQTVTLHTTGRNENGEVVAHARFTWSYKVKD
jgi:acyl-coenzyme A thioesterase PaaI-like protein